jgi:hypothetical protein
LGSGVAGSTHSRRAKGQVQHPGEGTAKKLGLIITPPIAASPAERHRDDEFASASARAEARRSSGRYFKCVRARSRGG